MTAVAFDARGELVGDGIAVVAVAGEADLYHAPILKEHILAAVAAGATRIVVDLTGSTFIDSATIGVLVESGRDALLGPDAASSGR